MNITEPDWRMFKKKLPVWQEAYMERLNREYIDILSGNGYASEKFWQLEQRIKKDRKSSGVITELTRRNAIPCIVRLLSDGIIVPNDLEGFSKDLVETVCIFWKIDHKDTQRL